MAVRHKYEIVALSIGLMRLLLIFSQVQREVESRNLFLTSGALKKRSSSVLVKLGDKCTVNHACSENIRNSHCQNGTCRCDDGYFTDQDTCYDQGEASGDEIVSVSLWTEETRKTVVPYKSTILHMADIEVTSYRQTDMDSTFATTPLMIIKLLSSTNYNNSFSRTPLSNNATEKDSKPSGGSFTSFTFANPIETTSNTSTTPDASWSFDESATTEFVISDIDGSSSVLDAATATMSTISSSTLTSMFLISSESEITEDLAEVESSSTSTTTTTYSQMPTSASSSVLDNSSRLSTEHTLNVTEMDVTVPKSTPMEDVLSKSTIGTAFATTTTIAKPKGLTPTSASSKQDSSTSSKQDSSTSSSTAAKPESPTPTSSSSKQDSSTSSSTATKPESPTPTSSSSKQDSSTSSSTAAKPESPTPTSSSSKQDSSTSSSTAAKPESPTPTSSSSKQDSSTSSSTRVKPESTTLTSSSSKQDSSTSSSTTVKLESTTLTSSSSKQDSSTISFTIVAGTNNDDAGTTAGVVVTVFILAFACVGIFFLWKRRRFLRAHRYSTNDGLEFYEIYRNKPILLSDLVQHVDEMEKESSKGFTEEFKLIKELNRDFSAQTAQLIACKTKNRYNTVLPYEYTRVVLSPIDTEEGSDYINASYIQLHKNRTEFIAAQGPLPATVNEFWRMVWENRVSIIVMLTQCMEGCKIKCEQYWPEEGEAVLYGDLVVRVRSQTDNPDYITRVIYLKLNSQTRIIKHFHFLSWPDHGFPESTYSLLHFINAVREHIPHSGSGPTVVHCSSGIGRTGMFIALDQLLQQIRRQKEVDIFGLVLRMHECRPRMIQNEIQYSYLFKCLASALTMEWNIRESGIDDF